MQKKGQGGSSVGRISDWKARLNTDMGLGPRCSKGFFSQSQLLVQTLMVSVQPSHEIACFNIDAHIKKNQTLAAMQLFGHMKNTPHTDRNG